MKKVLSLVLVIFILLSMASVCNSEEYNVPQLKKPRMFGPVGFYYLSKFAFIYEGTAKDGRPYEMYSLTVDEGLLMQSFVDGAEFVYFSGPSEAEWDVTMTDRLGRTDNVFNPTVYSYNSRVLKNYGITPYPTKRLSEGWEKGLTWEFHKADGTISYANKWHIGVLYEGKWYFFAIKIGLNEGRDNAWAMNGIHDISLTYRYIEEVTYQAVRSNAKIIIDGKEVIMEGYNIEGVTYFKLRDVAMALKGTPSEFNVEYYPEASCLVWKDPVKYKINGIVATLGNEEYVPVGGELATSGVTETTAKRVNNIIFYDRGVVLGNNVVNIGGYNYSPIRQIGSGVDFHVDWDEEKKAIIIDTTKYYWEK